MGSVFIGWILGLFFLLMAIGSFSIGFFVSLPFLIAATLQIPPVRAELFGKGNFNLSAKARGWITLGLFIIGLIFIPGAAMENRAKIAAEQIAVKEAQLKAEEQAQIDYFKNNKDTILKGLEDQVNKGEFQAVSFEAKKYLASQDPDLDSIYKAATEKILLAELKGIPATQLEKNAALYKKLVSLRPENVNYLEKMRHYTGLIAKEEARKQAKALREKQIETQFSSWDGSHRTVENFIKNSMHNPDSYDHVKTRYWDRGDFLVVETSFRGTNGFGAVVTNSMRAKVDISGNIIEILE
jgi:hypothetical protein